MAPAAPLFEAFVNTRSFYSGHYCTYGINVQGACDHNSKFLFLGVAGPGVMPDRDAVNEVSLGALVDQLPGLFYVLGDCAYSPSEHMIPVFGGSQALNVDHDNFNFYASQCRIRIEMAFGMMTQKWGILQRPLRCRLKKVWKVVGAIGRLHNFCIDERLMMSKTPVPDGCEKQFTAYEEGMRKFAAEAELQHRISDEYPQWSRNRERLVERIRLKKLARPEGNKVKKRSLTE